MSVSTFIAKPNEKDQRKKTLNITDNNSIQNKWIAAGIEITDFQMQDKTSHTIKYLLYILKVHWKLCIMATFDAYKYSFYEINTYCVNSLCILFFYFFFIPSTAKSLIKHIQWRVPTKGK